MINPDVRNFSRAILVAGLFGLTQAGNAICLPGELSAQQKEKQPAPQKNEAEKIEVNAEGGPVEVQVQAQGGAMPVQIQVQAQGDGGQPIQIQIQVQPVEPVPPLPVQAPKPVGNGKIQPAPADQKGGAKKAPDAKDPNVPNQPPVAGKIIAAPAIAPAPIIAGPVVRNRGGGNKMFSSVIPMSGDSRRMLAQINQLLEQKKYPQARQVIQLMLNDTVEYNYTDKEKEDDGNPIEMDQPGITLREHLEDLLKSDFENLLNPYQQELDPVANNQLEKYAKTLEIHNLIEVIKKYYQTPTGLTARRMFVGWHLDRGEYAAANMHLDRLLKHGSVKKTDRPEIYLMKLKCASQLEDKAETGKLKEILIKEAGDAEIEWQGGKVPLWKTSAQTKEFSKEITEWLDRKHQEVSPRPISDWDNPRGNISGNSMIPHTVPALEADFTIPLVSMTEGVQADKLERIREHMRKVFGNTAKSERPFLTWQPLMVGNLMLIKGLGTLKAFDIKTGELKWESVYQEGAFKFLVETMNSSIPIQPAVQHQSAVTNVVNGQVVTFYTSNNNNQQQVDRIRGYIVERILDDKLGGQISSDGERVFTINDLGSNQMGYNAFRGVETHSHPLVASDYNSLLAYDLKSGKLLWKTGTPHLVQDAKFNGYFLGVPTYTNGLLYALTEQQSEIHLTSFDPRNGELIASQPLCSFTSTSMGFNMHGGGGIRRKTGLRPILVNGIMICQTGQRVIYGVEPLTMNVMWVKSLDRKNVDGKDQNEKLPPQVLIMMQHGVVPNNLPNSSWEFNDGFSFNNLAFIPTETGKLSAMNVNSGEIKFELDQKDVIYPAGIHKNKLITIGKHTIDAWNLSDGKPAWKVPIQIEAPAGTPVLSGDNIHIATIDQHVQSYDLNTRELKYIHPIKHAGAMGNLYGNDQMLAMIGNDTASVFLNHQQTLSTIQQKKSSNDANAKLFGEILDLQVKFFDGKIKNTEFIKELIKITKSAEFSKENNYLATDVITNHILDGLGSDFEGYQALVADVMPMIRTPELQFKITERIFSGHLSNNSPDKALASLFDAMNKPELLDAPKGLLKYNLVNDSNSNGPVVPLFRTTNFVEISPSSWVKSKFEDYRQIYSRKIDDADIERRIREVLDNRLSEVEKQPENVENLYLVWLSLNSEIQGSEYEYKLLSKLIASKEVSNILKEKLLDAVAKNKNPDHAAWATIELIKFKKELKQQDEVNKLAVMLKTKFNKASATGIGSVSDWINENYTKLSVNETVTSNLKDKLYASFETKQVQQHVNRMNTKVTNYQQPYRKYETAYFVSNAGKTFTLIGENGETLMSTTLPNETIYIGNGKEAVIRDSNLVIYSNTVNLYAFDIGDFQNKKQPQLLWKTRMTAMNNPNQPMIYNRRVIINNGIVDDGMMHQQPIIGNSFVYSRDQLVTVLDNKLTAIDPVTSQVLWQHEGRPYNWPMFGHEKNLGFLDQVSRKLVRFKLSDGSKKDDIVFPPVGWTHYDNINGTFIMRMEDQNNTWIAGFDIDQPDSEFTWKRSFPRGSKVFVDNKLRTPQILVQNENEVYSINPDNGETLNTFAYNLNKNEWGTPNKIHLYDDGEQLYLFTLCRSESPLNAQQIAGIERQQVHGPLFCYKKGESKPIWTADIQNQFFCEDQPAQFPCLMFGAINGNNNRKANGTYTRNFEIICLNKKTGINIITDKQDITKQPYVVLNSYEIDKNKKEYRVITSTMNIKISESEIPAAPKKEEPKKDETPAKNGDPNIINRELPQGVPPGMRRPLPAPLPVPGVIPPVMKQPIAPLPDKPAEKPAIPGTEKKDSTSPIPATPKADPNVENSNPSIENKEKLKR